MFGTIEIDYDLLFNACRELFGPDIETSHDFLHYLQTSGIKSAFRRKVKETHPDLFAGKPPHVQDLQAALFCQVTSAYEMLSLFISQREQLSPEIAPKRAPKRAQAASRHEAPGAAGSGGRFLHVLPRRHLQFGRYLYYRQVITFQQLLQAVTWQRACRRPLGTIAREWGWMSAADVFQVNAAKMPGRFGEKAVRLGMLTPFRLNLILFEQQIRQQRIGQYFVQHKVLTPQELEFFLKELRFHNSRFEAGR